ncbi:MAG: hypothetical protein M3326_13070 [Actinomycetota bacterium]|nr:hypothetical protein [Actinomycetota bacterium]
MSPSEPERVPPEVLAIAVALAAVWPEAEGVEVPPAAGAPSSWRWGGRRWERPASYRWS